MAEGGPGVLERTSTLMIRWAGSGPAFLAAAVGVLAWLVAGPFTGFSNTWQLWANTATTIVTFLMVFLIQRAQNKDTEVLNLKLDELLAAQPGASTQLIDVEGLSEAQIRELHRRAADLRGRAAAADPQGRHSIEEQP